MRVNGDHERFKKSGEKNRAYEIGKLQMIIERLVMEIQLPDGNPQDFVDQLKEEGVLEG